MRYPFRGVGDDDVDRLQVHSRRRQSRAILIPRRGVGDDDVDRLQVHSRRRQSRAILIPRKFAAACCCIVLLLGCQDGEVAQLVRAHDS